MKLKRWRSTALRMMLVFGAIFGSAVALLLGFIYWETQSYLSGQVDTVLNGMMTTYGGMPRESLEEQIKQSIQ